MKKMILLILPILMTGCAEYRWVKPGATDQQETIAETACQAQALRDLPPDNVISGKYTSDDKKHKAADTSYTTSDANESQRDVLIRDCMFSKGWTQIEVQH